MQQSSLVASVVFYGMHYFYLAGCTLSFLKFAFIL